MDRPYIYSKKFPKIKWDASVYKDDTCHEAIVNIEEADFAKGPLGHTMSEILKKKNKQTVYANEPHWEEANKLFTQNEWFYADKNGSDRRLNIRQAVPIHDSSKPWFGFCLELED